jgi:hypothetical protein
LSFATILTVAVLRELIASTMLSNPFHPQNISIKKWQFLRLELQGGFILRAN